MGHGHTHCLHGSVLQVREFTNCYVVNCLNVLPIDLFLDSKGKVDGKFLLLELEERVVGQQ